MGQLPIERVTPDIVFENVGVDYTGPVYTKYGYVRRPTGVKSYLPVCIILCQSITDRASFGFNLRCLYLHCEKRSVIMGIISCI